MHTETKNLEDRNRIILLVPSSENMLSKTKNRRTSYASMLFKKLLQQVPHFESFLHVVVLRSNI